MIVDNGSTYPPLLEWYQTRPCEVKFLGRNVGSRAPWQCGLVNRYGSNQYVVTDPDLDLSDVPKDLLERLAEGLSKHNTWKCGLSLRIDDLPVGDSPPAKVAYDIESRYWTAPDGNGFYRASVDTTFALYRHRILIKDFYSATRTAPPYCARHLPWYVTKDTISEEHKFYVDTCTSQSTYSAALRS
jgi:hypothetical protein